MGGKEDKFDKFDEMGQLPGGYDVSLARQKALEHARERLSKEKDWLQGVQLEWEIADARFDEDADCYKVKVLCYPEDAEVSEKAQWEYHIDAQGNLYPGTPMLISKGKWEVAQSNFTEQEKEIRRRAEKEERKRADEIKQQSEENQRKEQEEAEARKRAEVEQKRAEEEKHRKQESKVIEPREGMNLFGILFFVAVVISVIGLGVAFLMGSFENGNETPETALTPPETENPTAEIQTPLEAVEPIPESTPTPIPTSEPSLMPIVFEMTSIPGGTFQMGDLSSTDQFNAKPVHTVTLSPFSMAKYEITYAKWMEVKDWGGSHGYSFNRPGEMGGEDGGGTQDENHPVTDIEWYDAVLWCNALSEKEGRTPCYYDSPSQSTVYRSGRINIDSQYVKWEADGYRLPTEAEWEYACRAGTITEYSFGNSIDSSDANYNGNEKGTTSVGSYSPNPWELYDMHGNVWEWCWDWYHSYSDSSESNPRGSSTGSTRVIRGGDWHSYAKNMRAASRNNSRPDFTDYWGGFRPVYSQ